MFTAIAIVVSFVAGVFAHKYVISEAASIKSHVSGELNALRTVTAVEFASIRAELKAAAEKA